MGMTLDIPGGKGREAGGSESEVEEAALLTVKIEEGATNQEYGSYRSWKRPDFPMEPPKEKAQPTPVRFLTSRT